MCSNWIYFNLHFDWISCFFNLKNDRQDFELNTVSPADYGSVLVTGIQSVGAIKIEYIINDDGKRPNISEPSMINTGWPATIVYNTGQKYTHKIVGHYNQLWTIFSIAYQPMPKIVFDDESFEKVSF